MARSLADVLAVEETRTAAGEAACGYTCICHPGLVCLRVKHPDDTDQRSPHLARLEAAEDGEPGDLVQWLGGCCVDGVPQTTEP